MPDKKPNIITVICHDMGHHLGCYGLSDVRTPNLDAFAEKGVRFQNSFCSAPQCSPSRAALWTGRYPHSNGVVGLAHGGFANELHADERHLAQMLGDAGYETHLFGAQHVSASAERCGFRNVHGGGACVKQAEGVAKLLENHGADDSPLFIQAAFGEPHRPFPHGDVVPLDPATLSIPPYLPDIPDVREDLSNLEAACSFVDRAFGVIVDAVKRCGMADDTIVVFTVDHGLAFPHGKMTLYDAGMETALLMQVPGVEGGRVFKEMISNVDFVPTILELLGMEVPANVQGRSFRGLLTGDGYTPHDAIFAEKTYHTYYDPMRAIRTGKWKLIANFEFAPHVEMAPDYDNNAKSYVEIVAAWRKSDFTLYHLPIELYDLEADPWEQNNLADLSEHEDLRNQLIRRLRQWMEDTGDPLLEGPMAQGAYRERMNAFKKV